MKVSLLVLKTFVERLNQFNFINTLPIAKTLECRSSFMFVGLSIVAFLDLAPETFKEFLRIVFSQLSSNKSIVFSNFRKSSQKLQPKASVGLFLSWLRTSSLQSTELLNSLWTISIRLQDSEFFVEEYCCKHWITCYCIDTSRTVFAIGWLLQRHRLLIEIFCTFRGACHTHTFAAIANM